MEILANPAALPQHQVMILRLYRLRDGRLVLETDGFFGDISSRLQEIGASTDVLGLIRERLFESAGLDRLFQPSPLSPSSWPGPQAEPDALDVPLPPTSVGKILALGKNFRAHAAEFGEEVPAEPLYFNKLPETLRPHGATVTLPAGYHERADHEAELAVVIAADGSNLDVDNAMEHVAGYCVANDLTLRSLQAADRKKGFPWFRAKNFQGSCPLGPCFVPRDSLDVSDLRVRALVNGKVRQDATTADFVVDIPHALAYLSRHFELNAGDLVLMGTPEGVGPLEDGDEVVCEVEGIGELLTRIRRSD